jgi:hypothetical protein
MPSKSFIESKPLLHNIVIQANSIDNVKTYLQSKVYWSLLGVNAVGR